MTGYRPLISSDAREQELREAWHEAKAALDPSQMGTVLRMQRADRELCEFLWRRASSAVAADRAKHPKAKRNLPVGAEGSNKTRALP